MILPRAFYDRPTLDVARDLIGKLLIHDTPAGRASGAIVEVEAYIGESDPACHAAPGRTPRNAPLYGPPGIAYVYLNYGMHYLVNAVTEGIDAPAAVLIRALAPVEGIALMRRRRARGTGRSAAVFALDDLCRGPGNLTRALGISLKQNRRDLCGSPLVIADAPTGEPAASAASTVSAGSAPLVAPARKPAAGAAASSPAAVWIGDRAWPLAWGPRIGIRVGVDTPWRCYAEGHPAVSGPRMPPRPRIVDR